MNFPGKDPAVDMWKVDYLKHDALMKINSYWMYLRKSDEVCDKDHIYIYVERERGMHMLIVSGYYCVALLMILFCSMMLSNIVCT